MTPEKLIKAASRALKDYMAVTADEPVLLVYDESTTDIAKAFIEAGKHHGIPVKTRKIPFTEGPGRNPDAETCRMLREYPVTLAPTKFSLTHCAAVKEAKEAGARIATLPGIDNDVFSRCLNASPEELKTTGEKWMEKLKGHKKVKITSPAGTDLEFGIGTHPVVNDDGRIRKKFSCGNLPAGEVYTAPDVGSANGTLVIDGSMGSFQWNENDSPAVIEIKNGSAVSFSGPRGIELEKALSEHGPGGFILAEFGIGTNPEAKLSGNLLEDEKVKGTVHLAFGNNCGFGGENDVQIHIDGLVLNPDVSVDSVKLMKKGKWYV